MTDCYLTQHSSSDQWTTTVATVDQVVTALRRAVEESPQSDQEINEKRNVTRLRWMTKGEKVTFVGKNGENVSVDDEGRVTVKFIRATGKVAFRDLTTFVVSDNKDGSTLVQGDGRSLDYHMWTACPCCFGGLCRYVACFLCCCGVCPTKDWGQNERTLTEIMVSLRGPAGSSSVEGGHYFSQDAENPAASTTKHPDVVDVAR